MPKHWKLAPDTPKQKAQDIIDNFGSHALARQQKARKKTFYLTTIDEDELISSQQRKYYWKFIISEFFVPYVKAYKRAYPEQCKDINTDTQSVHEEIKWSEKWDLWNSAWDRKKTRVSSDKVNIERSITNLTVKQMSEFIERCILFAAEKGYQIPQPCEADYDEYFLME